MKKFIFMFLTMLTFAFGTMSAQSQSNYAGSSKFTDNWSVTVQGGVLTTFNDFFAGHTAVAPIAVVGADKYFTPWFGVGVDGRTLIGTGHGKFNTHTAFDAVNVNGYLKFNIVNMFKFDGTRHFFEPVVYTGLGWGHQTCSDASPRNYMTYRAGVELNFNLGKSRAWAVVVNPAVVWGDLDNGKLNRHHGNLELTAGVVYHFKTSNGTHAFTKAHLYDAEEVARLNAEINDLKNRPATVVEKIVENTVPNTQTKYVVPFSYDNSELSDAAKQVLDAVPTDKPVVIDAYASKEPKSNLTYNVKLTEKRAATVKNYLTNRGVTVDSTDAHGCDDTYGRVAIVTVK